MDARQRQAVRRYVESLDRQRATLADEIADDVAQVQGLTMAERGEWIASVCRAAFAVLASRPDASQVIARSDPPAPDYEVIWRRLAKRRAGSEPAS